jgi:hypothetical protein
MKYYIEATQGGINTTKEIDAISLDDLLEQINKKVLGRLDYQVFSEKSYDFNNLVYTHHSDAFYK